MKKSILFCLFGCLSLLLFYCPASAFELKGLQPVQPNGGFSSFGTGTMQEGTLGVGVGFERSIDVNFYRTTLKAGYGLSSDAEFLVTVPYLYDWRDSVDGLEDVSLGVKHRFFRENTYGPSLAYLLKLSLPLGKDEFSTDGAAGAGIILSKKVGPFTGNVNFIYSLPFEDSYDEQLEIIVGFDLKAAHDFDIFAELYSADNYAKDSFDTVEGRLGYRIKTSDTVYTLIGAGYDFKNRDPEFRLIVSFNFLFEDIGKKGKSS